MTSSPDVSSDLPTPNSGTAERVTVSHVDKFYGDTPILRELTLEVSRGEVVVIIGASGSGKTTLLRCIAGLEPIQSGHIDVFGVPVNRAWELKGEVGFVFQHFNLFPHMTALANVGLALRKVQKLSRGEAKTRAVEALSLVGMDSFAGVRPRRLSGGQQQRVAIARSLAMSPRLMLFDEPTSALDRELVREVLGAMQDLARQHMTMIVVSHELAFAEQVAHRLVYMDEGRVVEEGTPDAVLHNPQHERTRRFLGQITIDLENSKAEDAGAEE
jgi:polar amino acid transport system ATP-binding protein